MATRLVKAWERKHEISRKLAVLAQVGLAVPSQIDFSDFQEYAEEYYDENEYGVLLSYLGWEEPDSADERAMCRCEALFSFNTFDLSNAEDYEKLILNLAALADDDLAEVEVSAELVFDPPLEEYSPLLAHDSPANRELVAEVQSQQELARREALRSGDVTANIILSANGKRVAMTFLQEDDRFDQIPIRCLAALIRLRTEESRYFVLSAVRDITTVGYLPIVQIEKLMELGLDWLWQVNDRLPLPRYIVTDR